LGVDPLTGILVTSNELNQISSRRYDLIVGADGARSAVRHSVLSQPSVTYECFQTPSRWKFLVADVQSSHNEYGFLVYKDFLGGWFHMPTGKCHLVVFWDKPYIPRALSDRDEARKLLNRTFTYPPADLESCLDRFLAAKISNETFFVMSQYHHDSGKVVLLGDAAHCMS
jgi:2-polyprenyl-6-methoxyphenol hydroxylase-like FAD-dependent oxidoreductase